MNKKDEKLIVFDTETTGTSKDDRIVSFGAVVILNREIIDESIEIFINPEIKMNEEAAKITNISDDFLKDKPKFIEVLPKIEQFIDGADGLIAHNAEFDQSFLNRELKLAKANYKIEDKFQIIDSLKLARAKLKGIKHNLDRLCDYYHIDRTIRETGHGALIDAKLLAKVYLKLTSEQREFNLEVSAPKKKIKTKTIIKKSDYKFKKITISEEELNLHQKIIQSIKK